MVEKEAEEKRGEYLQFDYTEDEANAFDIGYIAGAKAHSVKWHKVADGDYPHCEKGNYSINVLTDREDVAYYSYDDECWVVEPSSAEIDPPIAWCEIPKYEEKQLYDK